MIPVADIRRYFGVIDRLVNLEQVQFLLDEVFDYGKDYEDNLTQDFVTATQQRKAESMTAICEFIREHTSLFKGQLRTITCNNGLDSNFQEQECSEETLVEIARQLPTLQRPLYLDRRNWARFIVNHQWIDLSAVEEIAYPKELKPWWFKTACEHGELLQRCRSLQKVKMMSLGPGTFRWAVQEKRDLERRDGTDTAADTTNNNNLGRQQEQEHWLVPVRSVRSVTISQHNTNYADEINDIAIGFNRTLQRLSIDALFTIDQSSLRRSIHIGRGWVNLPVLRKLYLLTNAARLVLDRRLFALCPSLVRISIADQTPRYRCQDIEPCLPGHHSNLDTLSLQGWSALSFDPATLESTPKLTKLSLTTCNFSHMQCFIPPDHELDRCYGILSEFNQNGEAEEGGEGLDTARITRPHWSWNWHLPLLTCVHLTSEFAYRFEFKMLRGCPQLEILGLNMNSIDGPHTHTRVLSCADMFVLPSSSSSSPSLSVSSNVHQEERIIAPNLRSLVLSGHWVIDDTLLGELLAGMFPKLRSFTEFCSGGITLAGVLNMIRTRTVFVDGEGREVQEGTLMHLRGVTVSMSLPHSHEEMDVLGVYHGSYRVQERLRLSSVSKARVKFEDMAELQRRQFRFSTLWCVVLREPISLSFEGEER